MEKQGKKKSYFSCFKRSEIKCFLKSKTKCGREPSRQQNKRKFSIYNFNFKIKILSFRNKGAERISNLEKI